MLSTRYTRLQTSLAPTTPIHPKRRGCGCNSVYLLISAFCFLPVYGWTGLPLIPQGPDTLQHGIYIYIYGTSSIVRCKALGIELFNGSWIIKVMELSKNVAMKGTANVCRVLKYRHIYLGVANWSPSTMRRASAKRAFLKSCSIYI